MSNKQEWGRLVESAIGAHLINSALTSNFKVYYWRHRNDEVDFILERRGKVIGLEVKSNQANSISGLSAFQKQFNPDKVLLVGDRGLPWQEFLKMNAIDLF